MTKIFHTLNQGHQPLLISMPHVGTELPDSIARQMLPIAERLDDNDWHLPRLYDFAEALGASILLPCCSRYVIDLNRSPDDANLYPGQDSTGLCPVDTFLRQPLYEPDRMPSVQECIFRRHVYWKPYHEALTQELARLKHQHGHVLLWEAHSIRSEVPRFFEGVLPDFSFGTDEDRSCAPELSGRLFEVVRKSERFSAVLNGRFKGGYITRFYGRPELKIHAIQLELSQRIYMQETPPFSYLPELAAPVQNLLRNLLEEALNGLPSL